MHKLHTRQALIVALTTIVLLASVFAGVSAAPAATLLDDSTTSVVVLSVASNGQYKVNVEGNNPSDIITATATNGRLTFNLNGKKAWQLQGGLVPTDESSVWEACPGTKDGWFCLAQTTAPAATPVGTTFKPNEPYNLNPAGEYIDCAMWYVVPTDKTMTWTGGSSSVHVCFDDAAKDLLKEGYTAVFTETVDFQVRACRSYWEGEDSQGNLMNRYVPAGCWDIPFRAGSYRVNGWSFDPLCGEQVGFRVVPNDTKPWIEEKTCEQCVWPFPAALSVPVYRDGTEVNSGDPLPTPPTPGTCPAQYGVIRTFFLCDIPDWWNGFWAKFGRIW